MRIKKGQVSLELLFSLVAWLMFIAILAAALVSLNKEAGIRMEKLDEAMKVHDIANLIGAMQSSGFTVKAETGPYRYESGQVLLEYKDKLLAEKAVYGVDVNGEPV